MKGLYWQFLKKYVLRLDGSILPIAALALPVIMGTAGLGVDFSYWMMQKRNLQTAVDAAALAAAWEGTQGNIEMMEDAALKEAVNNGATEANLSEFSVVYDNDTGIVDVSLKEDTPSWVGGVFKKYAGVAVKASAQVVAPSGEFCILSLDDAADGAIKTSGSVIVDQPDCGMAANSNSAEALQIGGSTSVTIGDVALRGGYDVSGGSADFIYSSLYTRMPKTADPYTDLEVPEGDGCTQGQQNHGTNVTGNGTTTLSPGTYCGGIQITGNNDVIFEPGVYIIDGGDFSAIGGGTLYGEGVSFILTNSGGTDYGDYGALNISGGRDVRFSAPAVGEDMEGVVFYQDRNAPSTTSSANKLTGTADVVLDGVAYFPSQGLEFGGDDTLASATCTKLIAKTVTLSGNPRIDNDCEGKGTRDFAPPSVQLIF